MESSSPQQQQDHSKNTQHSLERIRAKHILRRTIRISYETCKERLQGYVCLDHCWEVAKYTKVCCKGNDLFTTTMGERSRNHCRDTSSSRENTASISKLKLVDSQTFSWGSLEGWFRHSYVHDGTRSAERNGSRREIMHATRETQRTSSARSQQIGARLLFYNISCM